MISKMIVAAALSLFVFLMGGCGQAENRITLDSGEAIAAASAESDPRPQQNSGQQEYAIVRALETSSVHKAVGSFVAKEEVNVSSNVGGTVTSLPVDVGDVVTTKTLIAQIDREDYEIRLESANAQVAVAEAGLNNARSEFERKKQLFEDGAIPPSTFDLVKTQLELAEAQFNSAKVAVKAADKALRDTTVKPPVGGVVSRRLVSEGEFAGSGKTLVVISIVKPIKMQFSVPERFAAEIIKGSDVTARLRAYPERTFSGKITRISPTLDPLTRTLPLEAEFANGDGLLKPGFFAECDLQLSGSRTYYLVPNEALHVRDGSTELLVAPEGGGDPEPVAVTLIERLGDNSKIIGPLEDGQRVLLR